ncbi:MAG: acyl-CoA thioesterase [Anaerolineales bacterium]|nr:acyl-CoA thioesterase [Anaerolineales bacterium]
MSEFNYYYPVEVRYGDIDAQRHVNNAAYFTYMEQSRIKYFEHLGLWDGLDFDSIGIILLETSCTFKAPITYGLSIRAGVSVVRMGKKSLEVLSHLEDTESGQVMTIGRSVLVAYDYETGQSINIPDEWRKRIEEFENLNSEA